MTLTTWFTIHAVVALAFGAGLLVDPVGLAAMYGMTSDSVGIFTARQLGATFLTFAAIAWLARNAEPGPALKAIVGGFAIGFIVGFAVTFQAQLAGIGNAMYWSAVAVWLILAAGYIWFFFTGNYEAGRLVGQVR